MDTKIMETLEFPESLKAIRLDGFESYLSEDSLRVYANRFEKFEEVEPRVRYIQRLVEFHEKDRDHRIHESKEWIARRLNKISDKFEGVFEKISLLNILDTENGSKRSIVFLWPVLKPEFSALSKEDLNKLIDCE